MSQPPTMTAPDSPDAPKPRKVKRKGVSVQVWLPEATVDKMTAARALLERPVSRPEFGTMPSIKLFLTAAVEALAERVLLGFDVEQQAFIDAGVKLKTTEGEGS